MQRRVRHDGVLHQLIARVRVGVDCPGDPVAAFGIISAGLGTSKVGEAA